MLILRKLGFHDFVLNILPGSPFNTLIDFLCSTLSLICLSRKIPLYYVCVCWVTSQAFLGTAN